MISPASTPPEKTLRRVLLIAALDGWSVMAIGALGSLVAMAMGDPSGLVVGLMLVTGGVLELRGRGRLVRGDPAGMRLLIRAQMLILAVLLVYCISRLGSFDEGVVRDTVRENLTPEMEALLQESGVSRADIVPAVKIMFYTIYGTVAFLSLIFQGGLSLYYRSRTPRVAAALAGAPGSGNPSIQEKPFPE